jgi:hypothetical protein
MVETSKASEGTKTGKCQDKVREKLARRIIEAWKARAEARKAYNEAWKARESEYQLG